MKARYTTKSKNLTFEIDGSTQKELFQTIAELQEVFEADDHCGCCNGTDLKFVVRNVDDNDFYELHCQNQKCRAKLAYGAHKKGGSLFPKRKDVEGKWLPNRGWTIFRPTAGAASQPSATPPAASQRGG